MDLPDAGRAVPDRTRAVTVALAVIAVAACAAYLRGYFANRSLWLDEALFALEFTNRHTLTDPFIHNQAAPVGFVALTMASIQVFGRASEYALRIVPLLAAIATVPLMILAARSLLSGWAAVFSAAAVVLAPSLVYYSSEFKPYSTDILAAVALIAVAAHYVRSPQPARTLWLLSATSAAAVWLSFPSVFIVVGVWLAVCAARPAFRDAARPSILAAFGVVCVSATASYFLSRSMVHGYASLQDYWAEGFLPLRWTTFYDGVLWLQRGLALFGDPLAAPDDEWTVRMQYGTPVLVLWTIGAATLWARSRWMFLMIAAPLACTLAAAGAGIYPASGRLLVFLLPVLAIGVGAGLDALAARWNSRLAAVIAAMTLTIPVVSVVQTLRQPTPREEVRLALEAVASRIELGDVTYIFTGAVPAYSYYRETRLPAIRALDGQRLMIGADHRGQPLEYIREICSLSPRTRVWFVISHPRVVKLNEREFLLSIFTNASIVTQTHEFARASAHLLDLSGPGAAAACALANEAAADR